MRRASRFPAMAALGFFASAVLRAPAVAESDTVWTPTIPPGWEKVSLPDLLSTGDFGFRASQVSGYLETIGDFDGDGHRDIAQVFVNRRTDQHAVFVTLNARAVVRIYKVIEEPANLMARIAISRIICVGQLAASPRSH